MTAQILIVEDDVFIAEYIEKILISNGFKDIFISSDELEAVQSLKLINPDVILLDINLSGGDEGIKFSEEYRGDARIIFLTGQKDDMTLSRALTTQPFSYLTKPIKPTDLIAAIKLAIVNKQKQTLTIKDGLNTIEMNYQDIYYFKAARNYVEIHLQNKKYVDRTSLKMIEDDIPSGLKFKRAHRSYIVNMSKVTRINNGEIHVNGVKIPLGRIYFKK